MAGDRTTTGAWRDVEVDGFAFRVSDEAARSWKAFDLMADLAAEGENLTPLALRKMMRFVEFVTDADEGRILEACGGELASAEDVVRLVSKIAAECHPKN